MKSAFFVALSLLWITPVAATKPPRITRSENYYGLYLNGHKSGWIRVQVEPGKTIRFASQTHTKIVGMGTVADVIANEERSFDAKTGLLMTLNATQATANGVVSMEGRRSGKEFRLTVSAGGSMRTFIVDVDEHLADVMAADKLTRNPKIGAMVQGKRFDLQHQRNVHFFSTVMAVEAHGNVSKAVRLELKITESGLLATEWYDTKGRLLEERIGNAYCLKLEAPEVAQKVDVNADILVDNVIHPPLRLLNPGTVAELTLTFDGMKQALPPTSPRQHITVDGNQVVMVLEKDPTPNPSPLGKVPTDGPDGEELKKALAAEPQIESDAPMLVNAAKHAIDGVEDAFEASSKLVAYVHHHVHSQYQPGFGDALQVYRTQRGDCTEHAMLFVALARAVGLPARMVMGVAYWEPADGFGWHAWAEVYIDGHWITVDPTWNQPIADATHVKLAGSDEGSQERIALLLGQLKIAKMTSK